MSKTIQLKPGYLGLSLDEYGVIDELLYECRDAFKQQGISKGWKLVSIENQPFSHSLLLAKAQGRVSYDVEFKKSDTRIEGIRRESIERSAAKMDAEVQKDANEFKLYQKKQLMDQQQQLVNNKLKDWKRSTSKSTKSDNTWMDSTKWISKDGCIVKKVFADATLQDTLTDLASKQTSKGYTLEKATICAQKLVQHVGVYAGDDESYTLFAPVFDRVIKDYHSVDVSTNVANAEDYSVKDFPQLPESGKTAIVSTRIRTARNLAGYPFTNNMTKEQRIDVESIFKKVFDGFTDPLLKGTYYPMKGMTAEKRKELIDAHYLYINDDPTLELCTVYSDWPEGRGIFINTDTTTGVFIVWVGEEDQTRIMAMNKGSDVQAVWNLFYKGLEAVHKGVKAQNQDFAFKKSHGYLSTCPTNLGTGMRASVHVDLPKFKTKDALKAFVKEKGWKIDIRGTRGEATDTSDCTVYDVSNTERLGSDCYAQIKTMVDGVTALLSN